MKQNGVTVLSVKENIPDTPEGVILESVIEGMNQYYSAELAQKISRGMKETRIKGLYQGGGVPYGYKIEGRKIVINEDTAPHVIYMFEQYSQGVYVKDIIANLASRGILYKGKPFVGNTVYNILKNEKYIGIYRHGDEVYENMYPQLVPYDLFEKVRVKVNKNHFGRRSVRATYLLRFKTVCGYCGSPISAETGTSKNGEVKRYYKCSGRKSGHNGCTKTAIRKDVLEKIVIDSVVNELSQPHIMNKLITGLMQLQAKQLKENPDLKAFEKEKRKVDTALQNLVSAIEQGIISKTTSQRLKELETQQEELERKILIEKSKEVIKIGEREMREYFEQALQLEPQMLVNYLVKQVVLYDDKVEIHLNSPIKICPDDLK